MGRSLSGRLRALRAFGKRIFGGVLNTREGGSSGGGSIRGEEGFDVANPRC